MSDGKMQQVRRSPGRAEAQEVAGAKWRDYVLQQVKGPSLHFLKESSVLVSRNLINNRICVMKCHLFQLCAAAPPPLSFSNMENV